jgi:hypothetical protein
MLTVHRLSLDPDQFADGLRLEDVRYIEITAFCWDFTKVPETASNMLHLQNHCPSIPSARMVKLLIRCWEEQIRTWSLEDRLTECVDIDEEIRDHFEQLSNTERRVTRMVIQIRHSMYVS